MLDSLYSEAIRKKDILNSKVEDIFDEKIDIEKNWNSEKIPPSSIDYIIAAGDGSFNKKKFLGYNFYAVAAESLIFNPHDSKLETVESIDLDILPHQKFIDDRLRNMMGVFELKTAVKTLKDYDVDFYMDDGSILGDLIRPLPYYETVGSDILKKIYDITTQSNITSLNFKEEFSHLFEKNKNKEKDLISHLENIERLIVMKQLLNHNEKIIAISKTSTSTDIFHSIIPDMAILDKFTEGEGYSKPVYKKLNSEVKRDFPVSNNFFRNLWFTIVFARLEKNKNIIKIELPYHANENEIKRILSIIKSNSTEGYPFLLKKAHHDVVIKHKDIESLSQIIEFIDKSGREMLD